MKLTELEARFMSYHEDGAHRYHREVDSIAEANGVMFLCPQCKLDGVRGVHSVLCWAPSVGMAATPGPGRWDLQGTSLEDLTLVAGSSSVRLTGGCCAHFHVTNGEIIMSADSGVKT